jgi:hypothetical protein
MFDYRKSNRSHLNVRQPAKSNSSGASMASSHSQTSGLAYIRALKANLQRSASQILAPPGSEAPAPSTSPQVDDTLNRRTQTDAECQAEAAMADEKDKIAVADELQRYLEEGVLNEDEYKDFNLTRYWQVS